MYGDRLYRNLIAVLIVVLALSLMVTCGGCATTYRVESCHGEVCTSVYARSYREFEQPQLHYERDDGTVFDFNASSATTAEVQLLQSMAQILGIIPSIMAPIPE